MNLTRFSWQSALHYWKSHLGTFLGALIGTGVLAGALYVGDSVKGSLKQQALYRIGSIDYVLTAGDRFFTTGLAESLQSHLPESKISTALMVRGVAVSNDRDTRANQVQILGINPDFWQFDPFRPDSQHRSGLWLNEPLARQLNVAQGDEILLRLEKPSLLTRESALTPQEDFSVAWRVKVSGVLPTRSIGGFSLHTGQSAPRTAFVPLDMLQEQLEIGSKANLVLAGKGQSDNLSAETLMAQVSDQWTLEDASLVINRIEPEGASPMMEVASPRVFLEPAIEAAATDGLSGKYARLNYLTYFVNDLSFGEKSTPYSMVTGTDDPDLIGDCPDGGIVISQWLADDLEAGPGDTLRLEYYLMGESNRLDTGSNDFLVHAVIPLAGKAADRSLMPQFPGVAEADSTRDWDAGFPLDMSRIREKDENFWIDRKGTPKAFITMNDARTLWGNRFGSSTAIRWQADPGDTSITDSETSPVLEKLDPESIGFQVNDVRTGAMNSASQSFDFGQLFISFSFFLILSAMILVLLFFQFGIERRLSEVGILTAVGYTVGRIRRILFLEGFVIALLGSIAGVVVGRWYAMAMVYGLTTAWKDAVAETSIEFFANPATAVIGLVSGLVVAMVSMSIAFWKYSRLPASRLLLATASSLPEMDSVSVHDNDSRRKRRIPWVGLICLVGAIGIFIPGLSAQGPAAAGMFFGAGALALMAVHAFFNLWLGKLASGSDPRVSRWKLALRNMARRPGRSLVVVASLACGGFLVTAISPFRMDASVDASKRSSGTGGYALYGRSAVPMVHDLNSSDGRDFFGFDPDELEGLEWVPMRVKEGDDASCLNLNMAQQPKVLGINPDLPASVEAFAFAGSPWKGLGTSAGESTQSPWLLLDSTIEDGSIPAVIDAATLQWALRKKVGDILEYPGPAGTPVRLRVVATLQGSMLQGSVIISDKNFRKAFPDVSGFREFLINAEEPDGISRLLTRSMEDFGLEISPSVDVLNRFNAVQNTYISTFQLLGQLGVIFGSLGLAVIALRNVLERSGELGLFEAVGYSRGLLRWQLGLEHWLLLVTGLVFGLVCAAIAVLPAVLNGSQSLSMKPVLASLSWILVSGSIWVIVAVFVAFRGHFRDALREL